MPATTAMSSSTALIRRQSEDMALMPPPPTKRTKRPATVLDEDDYTNALSDIIARDYYPGLAEAKAQEEYLTALESKDDVWIREAGQNLREAMSPRPNGKPSNTSRDSRFDTQRSWTDKTPVPDTPRGSVGYGSETPRTIVGSEAGEAPPSNPQTNTSNLSLTSFQAKYTSEDNESFNTLLDKQNNTRRKKHAYLWTPDQNIPSTRLLTHRAQQTRLITAKANHKALAAKHNEQALVPITTGATDLRPASVQSWQQKTPNNTLMFIPDSNVEDTGLQSIMTAKEAASKAGPKETVFANTRFPPPSLTPYHDDDSNNNNNSNSIPPSPSINTQIIQDRDTRRQARKNTTTAMTETSSTYGGETPRVNGYAFVDEDEPENIPHPPTTTNEPSYRDLLAGQTGDGTPNPFKISEIRRREDLHLRLVAKEQARKREKERDVTATIVSDAATPGQGRGGSQNGNGNMTPAARRLMEKLGRTPVQRQGRQERMSSKEMWTPGATPRRKR